MPILRKFDRLEKKGRSRNIVSNEQLLAAIASLSAQLALASNRINRRLDVILVTQDDINNAVTVVTNLLADMATNNQTVLTDITDIQAKLAAGQPVDTSKLAAVIANVQSVQTGLDTAVSNLNTLATS